MTELRMIADSIVPPLGESSRYAAALARALIDRAPSGASVSAFVAASLDEDYERLGRRLPGLARLDKSTLVRRDLRIAWRRGLFRRFDGMVHAPTLLAPLRGHGHRPGDQIVVTIHDTAPWTDPQRAGEDAAWARAMAKRAAHYADAVVVPTVAVSEWLDAEFGFGDRLHVIPAAPVADPVEATAGRVAVLAGRGDEDAVNAIRAALDADAQVAEFSATNPVPDCSVLVVAHAEVGFGMPVLDALAAGIPVVHPEGDALDELSGGATLQVAPHELGEAAQAVLDDATLADRLSVLGRDRARAFSWAATADGIWALHAEL